MKTKLSVLLFVLVVATWIGHQRFLKSVAPIAEATGETKCPVGQFMHDEGYCATPWQTFYDPKLIHLSERDWITVDGVTVYKFGKSYSYAVEKEKPMNATEPASPQSSHKP